MVTSNNYFNCKSSKIVFVYIVFTNCIVSLFGENIGCNHAFECVGTEWVLTDDEQHIYGNGYKSLFGANTSITTNYDENLVDCYAAFACAQISFINNTKYDINCDGSHSCANVSNIDGLSYIYGQNVHCQGSNSCQNSNIFANEYVYCEGSQSCIHTNISAPNITASGAYSLYSAIIESENDILNVYLRGYQSGFGATIICRAGNICNIKCYNNGCEMLYVECEPNSDCNILLNNNNSSITIPPITNMNKYDYTLYNMIYDSNILSLINNELCDNQSNINNNISDFVYDNYYEHKEIWIEINENNTRSVCCRGTGSCQSTLSIVFTETASDIVVCSGYWSCYNTLINMTNNNIFCEGVTACSHAHINGANNVYCLGEGSCANSAHINKANNVYCLSEDGCGSSYIQSHGNDINIYLFGYRSGSGTKIYCDIGDECQIYCGGYESCLDTRLYCNDNCFVDCNTDTGCTQNGYPSPTGSPTVDVDQSVWLCPNTMRLNIFFICLILIFFSFL